MQFGIFVDRTIMLLLAVLFAHSAFVYGGVEAVSQIASNVLIACVAALTLARAIADPAHRVRRHPLWLPLALFAGLIVVQLLPLPQSLVDVISPTRGQIQQRTLESDEIPAHFSLTVSHSRSAHALEQTAMMFVLLVALTVHCQSSKQVESLLLIVFGAGCLQAAVFFRHRLLGSGGGEIDGVAEQVQTVGSFINHSHFAQYLNLAIGAGLAVLLVRLVRDSRTKSRPAELLATKWPFIIGVAACIGAVALSGSRNGLLAMLVAGLIVGAMVYRRRRFKQVNALLVAIPLFPLVVLLFWGFDAVFERTATLGEAEPFRDRWVYTQSSANLGKSFLVFGSGIGSFAHVFPAFDHTGSDHFAEHADNDYAQLFAEGGLLGILTLLILAAMVGRHLVAMLRDRDFSVSNSAFGLLYALIAIAIQSTSDFGQRIPAVTMLSVSMLAVAAGVCGNVYRPKRKRERSRTGQRPIAKLVLAVSIVAICGLSLRHSYTRFQAETWFGLARAYEDEMLRVGWKAEPSSYDDLLIAAERAVQWNSQETEYRYWLDYYRWQSALNASSDNANSTAEVEEDLRLIAEDLAGIRTSEPTYHRPYVLEGMIRGNLLADQNSATLLLKRATELAQGDPQVWLTYGAWMAGQRDESEAKRALERALHIWEGAFDMLCRIYVQDFDDVDGATRIASDSPSRLDALLRHLDPERHQMATNRIRARRIAVWRRQVDDGSILPKNLKSLAIQTAEQNDHEYAASLFRKVLHLNYQDADVRFRLATSLHILGRNEEALREAQTSLRSRPTHEPTKALVRQLSMPEQ